VPCYHLRRRFAGGPSSSSSGSSSWRFASKHVWGNGSRTCQGYVWQSGGIHGRAQTGQARQSRTRPANCGTPGRLHFPGFQLESRHAHVFKRQHHHLNAPSHQNIMGQSWGYDQGIVLVSCHGLRCSSHSLRTQGPAIAEFRATKMTLSQRLC